MEIQLTPSNTKGKTKCLLLIGGTGDTIEKFQPLGEHLEQLLPDHAICTFSLSQRSEEGTSLLDVQEDELSEIISQLTAEHSFSEYDLFATSMGAYAAVKVLMHPEYRKVIRRVVFFDPADYYISDTFSDPDKEITWSGYQQYSPNRPVISSELSNYQGSARVDVVHLTVRNHGPNGYQESDFAKRGIDSPGCFPRLNTAMVKKFYENTPVGNRGEYREVGNLPHGFFRDGNIKANLQKVARITAELVRRN